MINISSTSPSLRSPTHPLSTFTGRHSYSFFELRPDNDVLVIRDYDYDSSDLLLRGVLVLCLQLPLRIEDVHLQLTGTLRHLYAYSLSSLGESAVSYLTKGAHHSSVDPRRMSQKVRFLEHRWQPFVGMPGKGMTLPPGNYEWPFEFALPRDAIESVEGIPEMSVTYMLKATVNRGKLAHDLHTYKQLRIIRAPSPDALELTQPVSVEDVWSNKIEYSIVAPQKAVPFGGLIPIKMRLTPLLKGLELRDITARFIETRECILPSHGLLEPRKHRTERVSSTWKVAVSREEFWHDTIEETGQEGWVITKSLDLPKELYRCIQDLSLDSIKVRHKLALTVSLRNPDGHFSELLAKLPICVVFYPNITFDKHGHLVRPPRHMIDAGDLGEVILPVYGEHIHDELYDGQITPPSLEGQIQLAAQSGARPDSDVDSLVTNATQSSESDATIATGYRGDPSEASVRQRTQGLNENSSTFDELERVPSYQTAIRTPFRQHAVFENVELPSYLTSVRHSESDSDRSG